MREGTIVAVITAIVVAGIVVIAMAVSANGEKFRKACDEIHGTAVFDGRQWQCMKGKP